MKVALRDFFRLFYPDLCINCEKQLHCEEKVLCIHCYNDLPKIEIIDFKNNEISNMFFGKVYIEKAYSFLYYRKKGITKNIISKLKYNNRQDVGYVLGTWFGNILKEKKVFNDVDLIIPVPLHHKKLKKRGYNQITKFTESLSKTISIPYNSNILFRDYYTKTQTKKNRLNRFLNMTDAFQITNGSSIENKHVLLVDDIITTGATLYACCKELQKIKNINISIVTIAFTEQN